MESSFTPLERAVLAAICGMYPEDRATLEARLATATLHGRENDGYGFYTRFGVDRASTPAIGGMRLRNGSAGTPNRRIGTRNGFYSLDEGRLRRLPRRVSF